MLLVVSKSPKWAHVKVLIRRYCCYCVNFSSRLAHSLINNRMRNILFSFLTMLVVGIFSEASAKICPLFLNDGFLDTTHLSYENGELTSLLNGKEEDIVTKAQSYLADKEFVTAMVDGLRINSEFFNQFLLEERKAIKDVFHRYENTDYYDGGRMLTDPEHLTYAILEFSILDNPSRANVAIARLKRTSIVNQYRYPRRILLPLYTFLDEAREKAKREGNIKAEDMFKTEADAVWKLYVKLTTLNTTNPQ